MQTIPLNAATVDHKQVAQYMAANHPGLVINTDWRFNGNNLEVDDDNAVIDLSGLTTLTDKQKQALIQADYDEAKKILFRELGSRDPLMATLDLVTMYTENNANAAALRTWQSALFAVHRANEAAILAGNPKTDLETWLSTNPIPMTYAQARGP